MTIEDTDSNADELTESVDSATEFDRGELERIELFRSVESTLFEPILRGCPVRTLQPGEVLDQRW